MRIIIHPHAFKHGLHRSQIMAAYESGFDGAVIRWKDKHADPPRWSIIGFDSQTRLIELIAIKLAQPDTMLIIHANYLTKGFRNDIRRIQ